MAALVVALIVIYVSVQLGKRSVDVLLDAAPKGLEENVRLSVQQIDGVRACQKVRVRRSGAGSFVDLILEVDGDTSFDNAHQITARVEEVVRELSPGADVVVHYEPGEESANISALIARLARQVGAEAHNIWVRQSDHRYHVELHVEVERGWSLTKAHDLATRLETLIKETAPEVGEVVIHLEPVGDLEISITELPHTDHSEIEAEIVSLVDNLVGEGACHRVNIWDEPQGLVASLHCSLKSELSVEEAHELSEQWEGYLRERIPALRRVLIHLEPS